jgi:hypothetical protein
MLKTSRDPNPPKPAGGIQPMQSPASTAAIVMSYKRPQNIGRLVRTLSEALPQSPIFVIDHGEGENSLTGRDDIEWDRCWLRTQKNIGPGVRFQIAADWPFEHYLCVDDDTFLTVAQIRALMLNLALEPDRAHGIMGQLLTKNGPGDFRVLECITHDSFVSVLNRIYAFTRARAISTLKLAELVGYDAWGDVFRTEDILLSCAGALPSRVHDVGPFEECGTNSAEGIALHRGAGFNEERLALMETLLRMNRVYVAGRPSE